MERFDVVTARYRPLREDDLVPGAGRFIGMTAEWQASWVIEDGPYEGQWLMAYRGDPGPPFAGAPLCDLEVIDEDDWRDPEPAGGMSLAAGR